MSCTVIIVTWKPGVTRSTTLTPQGAVVPFLTIEQCDACIGGRVHTFTAGPGGVPTLLCTASVLDGTYVLQFDSRTEAEQWMTSEAAWLADPAKTIVSIEN
jgi:hypothetical protein